MASVLEIIQGLQQAAANSYDGAHDKKYSSDGEEKRVGALAREEGDAILDRRVMDGFSIKIMGDILQINYQSEIRLSDVYAKGFEEECERKIGEISGFLKKEFKSITGNTISLKAEGEVYCLVQNISRVTTFVNAHRLYKIGDMEGVETVGTGTESKLDSTFQKFLDQGGFKKGTADKK